MAPATTLLNARIIDTYLAQTNGRNTDEIFVGYTFNAIISKLTTRGARFVFLRVDVSHYRHLQTLFHKMLTK